VPLTINVVTSEFIETIGATNLAYTTGIIAGASGPTQGGGGTNFTESFIIRGLPVRFVFRDGRRNWRGNEPLFMDRVEVLKGPTAILYGESLPGGTLNYITKIPQFTAGGSIGVQLDSYGAYRADVEATSPLGASGKVAYLWSGRGRSATAATRTARRIGKPTWPINSRWADRRTGPWSDRGSYRNYRTVANPSWTGRGAMPS
jgi:iron complex outermembrane receptor protein